VVHTVVTEASVERDDHGLLVTWVLAGDDDAVDVAVGITPERIEHQNAVTVPAGQRTLRIDDPGAVRQYVSVSPTGGGSAVVAAERRVPLQGAINFRDLGGYRTVDGRVTRWGRVFRSDGLHSLTAQDQDTFKQLGLRVVYDLRLDNERSSHPNLLPADADLRSVGLVLSGGTEADGGLPALERLVHGEHFVLGTYRDMLREAAPVFGSLLTGLTEPGGLPAVFHCVFGKDRTGLAAALLLTVLGVALPDVLDDYELTGRYQTEEVVAAALARLEGAGLAPETAAALFGSPRWIMQTALAEIEATHGSITDFLLGPAQMTSETLATLRALLVT
jgi:protein-tyrosine phosphatase